VDFASFGLLEGPPEKWPWPIQRRVIAPYMNSATDRIPTVCVHEDRQHCLTGAKLTVLSLRAVCPGLRVVVSCPSPPAVFADWVRRQEGVVLVSYPETQNGAWNVKPSVLCACCCCPQICRPAGRGSAVAGDRERVGQVHRRDHWSQPCDAGTPAGANRFSSSTLAAQDEYRPLLHPGRISPASVPVELKAPSVRDR
jgi:hypothetical protein